MLPALLRRLPSRLAASGGALPAASARAGSSLAGGADPTSNASVQATAGVPDVGDRPVLIYAPARSAAQQGLALTAEGGGPAWKIEFPTQGKWVNPLIGWTSSADPVETVARQLYFDSRDAAVAFAERAGWRYEVEEPPPRDRARPKRFLGYGDNFHVRRKGTPHGGLRSEAAAAAPRKRK